MVPELVPVCEGREEDVKLPVWADSDIELSPDDRVVPFTERLADETVERDKVKVLVKPGGRVAEGIPVELRIMELLRTVTVTVEDKASEPVPLMRTTEVKVEAIGASEGGGGRRPTSVSDSVGLPVSEVSASEEMVTAFVCVLQVELLQGDMELDADRDEVESPEVNEPEDVVKLAEPLTVALNVKVRAVVWVRVDDKGLPVALEEGSTVSPEDG